MTEEDGPASTSAAVDPMSVFEYEANSDDGSDIDVSTLSFSQILEIDDSDNEDSDANGDSSESDGYYDGERSENDGDSNGERSDNDGDSDGENLDDVPLAQLQKIWESRLKVCMLCAIL